MNRRAYLTGVVVTLTGCNGGRVPGRAATTTQSSLPESVNRTVTLVDKEDIPPELTTEATIDVVEPQITTDHTARIRATVRNTGETSREYSFDPKPPLQGVRSVEGPGELLLSTPGVQEETTTGCWRLESWTHGDGRARVELDPDEAVQNTLNVWDVSEDSDCLAPGEYTFRSTYPRLSSRNSDTKWSFSLQLEKA